MNGFILLQIIDSQFAKEVNLSGFSKNKGIGESLLHGLIRYYALMQSKNTYLQRE